MQILKPQESIVVDLTMAGLIAFLIFAAISKNTFAQPQDKRSALVVRVAVFSSDQKRLDHYCDFIDGHLFPTLRLTHGYVGAFLGRAPNSGQLISLSFWRAKQMLCQVRRPSVARYPHYLPVRHHGRWRCRNTSSSTATSTNRVHWIQ